MFKLRRIKLGFKNQIYLVMFSLLIFLGLIIFIIVSRIMQDTMVEENKNRAVSIGVNLSARLIEPILALDYFSMKKLVDETVLLSDDIYYTFVLDQDNYPVIHTFKNGFPVQLIHVNKVEGANAFSQQRLDTGKYKVYDYALPIFVDKNRIGTLRLGLLTTRVEKITRRILLTALFSTIFSILIAALTGFFLFHPMTKNIKRLHEASEQAMRGDLNIHSAPLLKKNCWDIMNCSQKDCPAFHNTGQRCWYTAGTLCKTCVAGDYAKKISSCQQCKVYKACSGNEIQSLSESFDYMILSLKDHLAELNLAKEDVSNQKGLLQTILDGLPDFVSLQNEKAEYISINHAFCTMVGKKQNDILGKTAMDLFEFPHAGTYLKEDLKILETGKPLVMETTGMDTSGSKWLHVVKSPILKENGDVSGLVASGRDISDNKTIQEQLCQAQKMESVGELAAGIAHEINTPLGIILGYAQILQEDVKPGSQNLEDLQLIEKHSKICSRIVGDLLRFSRRTQSIVTQFDIHHAINDVLNMVEHTFNLDHVTIKKNYGAELPFVKGDEEKIKQVFINLLNNALDAIGKDGHVSIRTSSDSKKHSLVITIADTGTGILLKHINKLFDPFFTTKGVGKGTGLGLSVTFGIIKEHGGTIQVESKQAKEGNSWIYEKYNTVFIITLPMSKNNELK
jgi:PAS domain S-box-containing protein